MPHKMGTGTAKRRSRTRPRPRVESPNLARPDDARLPHRKAGTVQEKGRLPGAQKWPARWIIPIESAQYLFLRKKGPQEEAKDQLLQSADKMPRISTPPQADKEVLRETNLLIVEKSDMVTNNSVAQEKIKGAVGAKLLSGKYCREYSL